MIKERHVTVTSRVDIRGPFIIGKPVVGENNKNQKDLIYDEFSILFNGLRNGLYIYNVRNLDLTTYVPER